MRRILIIDDDLALCRSLEIQLGADGHQTRSAATAAAGLKTAAAWGPELVLLDFHLPDQHGLQALPKLLALDPEALVVIMTGDHDTRAAIEAMSAGACDYLRKPFDFDDVLRVLNTNRRARRPQPVPPSALPFPGDDLRSGEMVGSDRAIVETIKQIGLLARSRVPVLIQGESGTGKDLAARMLHEAAGEDRPFVAVNCSSVVPTLMESEFFGHEKGAFTGADQRKIGMMEYAGNGTLFLDEIGDLPLNLQGKLLRVLQEEEFVRVGGLESIRLRARILSATNRSLEDLIRRGAFREDLYYRLAISTLVLPPLRERRADIPLLVRYILARLARKLHRPVDALEARALERLVAYDWPGNVRELENVLTRAAVFAHGPVLAAEDLDFFLRRPAAPGPASEITTLAAAEREHLLKALLATGWNITRTARALEISPTTLRKKIGDYNLKA